MKPPFLLLVNRHAHDGAVAAHSAADGFAALGLPLIVADPENAAEANALVREHRGRVDAVVVAGGDGSISAVLPALLELGLPLGILPTGTANDFARTLGIPQDIEAAIETIAAGRTRTADVGEVNGRYFINSATLGLPCELAADLSGGAKKALGPFAFVTLLPRIARYARPFGVRLIYDGRVESFSSNGIVVGNGRYEGGFPIRYEGADDGTLNIIVAKSRGVIELLRVVVAVFYNRPSREAPLARFTTREIRIETSPERRISADGDIVSSTPATIVIHPGALTVFAP